MKKADYIKLNESFTKRLVFRLGDSAGLFSEINNMFFSMVWALNNKVKFELCSHRSNLGKDGWNTFFVPFTNDIEDDFLYNNNRRCEKSAKEPLKIIQKYKKQHNIDFFTQDIFLKVYENEQFINETFKIPELSINGNSFHAAGVLAKSIFEFNKSTMQEIETLKRNINLPKNYISLQVRYGDIITECNFRHQELLNAESYVNKIKSLNTNIKDIFVFTDDYRVIPKMQNYLPEYKFYTLCRDDELGFVYSEFMKQPENVRQKKLIKVLANVEICRNSSHFIGTRVSNPSWFLSFVMPKDKISFVDCETLVWQSQYNKLHEIRRKFWLFNILPLFSTINGLNSFLLFMWGIPLYTIKKKSKINRHYLFGFIPFLKIKEK